MVPISSELSPESTYNPKLIADSTAKLFASCYSGNDFMAAEIIEAIIEANKNDKNPNKIDVNQLDQKGNTPLILAASKNMVKTVRALLKEPNIAINYQNQNKKIFRANYNALMYACKNGALDAADILLDHPNVLVHERNPRGEIAFDLLLRNYPSHIQMAAQAPSQTQMVAQPELSLNDAPYIEGQSEPQKLNRLIRKFLYRYLINARYFINGNLIIRREPLLLTSSVLSGLTEYWSRESPYFREHFPFTHEPQCEICHSTFSMFTRRHHCRGCGNAVCSNHSKEIRLDAYQPPIRYCVHCLNYLYPNPKYPKDK